MEFFQDNIAVQIALLVIGLGLVVFFGIRAIKDRKAKAAKKKSSASSRTGSTNRGINRKS